MSLRFYIFAILTTVVLLISSALSYQSARFFFDGFDFFYSDLMEEIGEAYPEDNLIEQKVLGYHVTTDWSKVPQPVRNVFPTPPTQYNVKLTQFFDWIYIAPPQRAYSVMAVRQGEKVVYVSDYNEHIHQDIQAERDKHGGFHIDPMLMLVLLGLAAIGLFILVLLVIFKRLARPAESLQNWASQLTMQDLDKPLPDFTFRELNELARLIRNNIASEANAIKREQTFLSYASHELRTPIAVLRTNATLLDKINPNPTDKERKVRDRISRASLTMKSMTETLLWLSRDEAIDMPVEPVKFGELLQQLSDELGYLLNGKEIELSLYSDGSSVEVAKTPCLIMLNNLIRNAFQHTQQGLVSISHNQNQVQIYNKEAEQTSQIPTEVGENLGFGLGMQLVDKLAKQFGWRFESEQKGNEFKVRIQF